MMDTSKHTRTVFSSDLKQVLRYHNDPKFVSSARLTVTDPETSAESILYEITKGSRRIHRNRPVHVGVAVYDLAKLRMLEFYYDFIDLVIPREKFVIAQCDTDSVRF